MQNVKATITFTLEDEANGVEMHRSTLEYNGLSEERVLFIEKHLIQGFLGGLHAEATEAIEAEKQKK